MELVALWGLCREALAFSQGKFFPYGAATPIRTACLPPIHLLSMLKTLPAEFLACESPPSLFPSVDSLLSTILVPFFSVGILEGEKFD